MDVWNERRSNQNKRARVKKVGVNQSLFSLAHLDLLVKIGFPMNEKTAIFTVYESIILSSNDLA